MAGGTLGAMEKTTLYLPTELQQGLRDAARREGRSQAEIVREAVSAYLTDRPRLLPKSMGALRQRSGEHVPAEAAKAWVRDAWKQQRSG